MTLPPGLWWRVPLSAAAAVGLLAVGGETAVQAALPSVRWVVEQLASELKVLSLTLGHSGADRVVLLQVQVERALVLGGTAHLPEAGSTAQASTLALQCLHGPALALGLAVAWPGSSALRLVAAATASVLLLLADLPVVLAGAVWQMLVDSLAPGDNSPLLASKAFISRGGRLALGLAAGAATVLLCERASCQPGDDASRKNIRQLAHAKRAALSVVRSAARTANKPPPARHGRNGS